MLEHELIEAKEERARLMAEHATLLRTASPIWRSRAVKDSLVQLEDRIAILDMRIGWTQYERAQDETYRLMCETVDRLEKVVNNVHG